MKTSSLKEQQQRKIKSQPASLLRWIRAVAARPRALRAYGIKEGAWSNRRRCLTLVHQMRARIMTSSNFKATEFLGAILFEGTWTGTSKGQRRGLSLERETRCDLPESGQGPIG